MSWRDDLDLEFNRGRQAEVEGNTGKVRTCARRAVGIVVTEYQKQSGSAFGSDIMRQLRGIAADGALPEQVRKAAERLQSRIAQDFTSPSEHPLEDARLIIEHFKQQILL